MTSKINLFFENNGKNFYILNRSPFQNATPRSVICKHGIINSLSPGAFLGVDNDYERIFNTHTTIPKDVKFYYPIMYDFSQLREYVNVLGIPASIIQSIKNGMCKILIASPWEGWQLEWYDDIVEPLKVRYDLSYANFVVMCGNMTPSPNYAILYYNIWEMHTRWRNIDDDRKKGYAAIFENGPRKFKFICLNRRSHAHRFAIFTKLFPYRDQGLLSLSKTGSSADDNAPIFRYYNTQKTAFECYYPEIYQEWVHLNIENEIPYHLPVEIDPVDWESSQIPNPTEDANSEKFYSSYLHVVAETFVDIKGFYSEKIFKPIIFFQPFVLIGSHLGLETFRTLGFKTFSEVIDESYDLEPDKNIRLQKATAAIVEFISRDDLEEVLKQIWPILKYNHDLFIERQRMSIDLLSNKLHDLLED